MLLVFTGVSILGANTRSKDSCTPELAQLSRSADIPRVTTRARRLPPDRRGGTSPRLPVHGEVASDRAAGQAAGLPPNPGRAGRGQAAPQSLARDKQGAQIAQLGREANDQANDQTAVQLGGYLASCASPLVTVRDDIAVSIAVRWTPSGLTDSRSTVWRDPIPRYALQGGGLYRAGIRSAKQRLACDVEGARDRIALDRISAVHRFDHPRQAPRDRPPARSAVGARLRPGPRPRQRHRHHPAARPPAPASTAPTR